MALIFRDFLYSLRTLRRSPVFLAVAVLSLALGIGANTAIFTLVHQLILESLPVKDPQQLVMLAGRGKHYGGNNGRDKLSYPMYQQIRDKNQVFSGMFACYPSTVGVTVQGGTELIGADFVSGNYFPVLGIGAAAGRVFNASDDQMFGGHPLAVLSYGYWRSRFGTDPGIVGKHIVVNGSSLTIIGVSQAGFDGVEPGRAPQIRIPLTMVDSLPASNSFGRLRGDRFRWVEVFGRLKPEMTLTKAQAGLQPLFHQIIDNEVTEEAFAKASSTVKQEFLHMWMEVMPGSKGRSNLRRTYSKPLFALMGIVGLVLLIACSNLANLLIARASARQKEIAVRLALGASRGRLIRQLLVESLVLSATGGVLGVGLAIAIDRALIRFLPSGHTPLSLTSTPDVTVLAFTFGVSLLAGAIFGLVPAIQATRPNLAGTLKDQAGAVIRGSSAGLRKGLVVAQVSLSLLLLIGAGLFLQSLRNLKSLDPGFEVKNLVAFDVDPTLSHNRKWSAEYYRRLHDRLSSLAGVDAHTIAVVPVLEDNEWDNWVTIEGYSVKPDERPDPHMQYCTPGFFATLKIPIRLGRDFTDKDNATAPKVGIVNQKFVNRYFGNANPLGRHVGMGIDPGTPLDVTIIGVVGDTKYESMRDEIPYEMYVPAAQQGGANSSTVYVRAQGNPAGLFNLLRREVQAVDSDVPMFDLRTVENQVEISLLTERLLAALSTVFGLLATLLAALGLYGVMAFMVARRTREIGIRMALGAGQGTVVWMVLRETLTLAGAGVAIGLAGAYGVTRLIQTQLFGVQPTDLLTMALASLGIAAVTALAGYIPARRATTIDPMLALRWE
jgi:predicted permease